MVNCKECANKRCKNNGCEYATYNCPDFMVTKKEGVDMVEVIRCKDCKHWNKCVVSGEWPDKVTCACKIVQHFTQNGWRRYTAPDDYCSFAERVDDNEHE